MQNQQNEEKQGEYMHHSFFSYSIKNLMGYTD